MNHVLLRQATSSFFQTLVLPLGCFQILRHFLAMLPQCQGGTLQFLNSPFPPCLAEINSHLVRGLLGRGIGCALARAGRWPTIGWVAVPNVDDRHGSEGKAEPRSRFCESSSGSTDRREWLRVRKAMESAKPSTTPPTRDLLRKSEWEDEGNLSPPAGLFIPCDNGTSLPCPDV